MNIQKLKQWWRAHHIEATYVTGGVFLILLCVQLPETTWAGVCGLVMMFCWVVLFCACNHLKSQIKDLEE